MQEHWSTSWSRGEDGLGNFCQGPWKFQPEDNAEGHMRVWTVWARGVLMAAWRTLGCGNGPTLVLVAWAVSRANPRRDYLACGKPKGYKKDFGPCLGLWPKWPRGVSALEQLWWRQKEDGSHLGCVVHMLSCISFRHGVRWCTILDSVKCETTLIFNPIWFCRKFEFYGKPI